MYLNCVARATPLVPVADGIDVAVLFIGHNGDNRCRFVRSVKIALISFEYPPDTAEGGIGSYTAQAARMLGDRGHDVEVFCASYTRERMEIEQGIVVHRVLVPQIEGRRIFPVRVGMVFRDRHAKVSFDVLEGPDWSADAAVASALCPDVSLVVRLHTPACLMTVLRIRGRDFEFGVPRLLSTTLRPLGMKIRRMRYRPPEDPEYLHAASADLLVAPSRSIKRALQGLWGIRDERFTVVPNVYVPSVEADAPAASAPQHTSPVVTFIGRLELRKGVLDLARAIPRIVAECPGVRFELVGRAVDSPDPDLGMEQYLGRVLGPLAGVVHCTGHVTQADVHAAHRRATVCVLPSLWENFPMTCLEAMASGLPIVASREGGMAEMLVPDESGVLIPARDPAAIADAVVKLLRDPALRARLGANARQRVLEEYGAAKVAPLQEASYETAIENRRWAGRLRSRKAVERESGRYPSAR